MSAPSFSPSQSSQPSLPLVSICVPVYRAERYMERCAESLFSQTYSNCEFLFVDDCTPDCSFVVLEQVVARFLGLRNRIRIVRHAENKGSAVARNTAIEHAKGDFLMFVDADDYAAPDMVLHAMTRQQQSGADIVSCGHYRLLKDKTEIKIPDHFASKEQMTLNVLKFNTLVSVWGRLIRTDLFRWYQIRCVEQVNISEDYQLMSRLCYHASSVATVDEPLYYYDCTNVQSYTNSYSMKVAMQTYQSVDYLLDLFRNYSDCRPYLDALRQGTLRRIAYDLCFAASDSEYDRGLQFYKFLKNKQSTCSASAHSIRFYVRMALYVPSYPLLRRLMQVVNRFYKY